VYAQVVATWDELRTMVVQAGKLHRPERYLLYTKVHDEILCTQVKHMPDRKPYERLNNHWGAKR
jgi:hypothetical protein